MNIQEMQTSAEQASDLMAAMANRNRLMILCHLGQCEMRVGELQDRTGLSQSALSQHLARLRRDGLVSTRRESQAIYYRIDSPEVMRLIDTLYGLFCNDSEKDTTNDQGS
jgi:DNA-binding transcriptional ArsR family regulator